MLNVIFIRSWCVQHLNMALPPHTNLNINLLERIQRSAARFCYNDYSTFSIVSTMLNQLELYLRTKKKENLSKSVLMFKMLNSLIDISISQFISKYRSLRGGYYTWLCTKIDSYKFSFFPSVIKLWNSFYPYL